MHRSIDNEIGLISHAKLGQLDNNLWSDAMQAADN